MKKAFVSFGIIIILFGLLGCSQGKKNNKPVIESLTSTSTTLKPGQTSTITVTAEDEDDDSLDYSWEANGGTLSTDKGKTVVWTAPSSYRSFYIEVEVDDDEDKARAGITLQVTEDPKLTGITFNSNTVAGGGTITFTATVSPDLSNAGMGIVWSSPDGGSFSATDTISTVWTAPTAPGNYDVTVTVSDGTRSDTLTIEVTVT